MRELAASDSWQTMFQLRTTTQTPMIAKLATVLASKPMSSAAMRSSLADRTSSSSSVESHPQARDALLTLNPQFNVTTSVRGHLLRNRSTRSVRGTWMRSTPQTRDALLALNPQFNVATSVRGHLLRNRSTRSVRASWTRSTTFGTVDD
jgi:hypothetical protein